MKYIAINIICLTLFSQASYGPSKVIYGNSRALGIFNDLNLYKDFLTSYKSKFKAKTLNYKDYPAYELKYNRYKLKYGNCPSILKWIKMGDIMVESLNAPVANVNKYIYPVYWTKLEIIAKKCVDTLSKKGQDVV